MHWLGLEMDSYQGLGYYILEINFFYPRDLILKYTSDVCTEIL